MKQLAWPSKPSTGLCPRIERVRFSTTTSLWKWATEPALEVGRLVASPSTKMSSWPWASSVCLSVGTKASSSPSPEASMNGAPMWVGMVTSRSNGTSRSSQERSTLRSASTSAVLNSLSTRMPRSPSIEPRTREATGLVNAPSSGVT